jgi:hypothetical protein
VESVYEGWALFAPLLTRGDLLVPYPTPILPLTKRARENRLVMVQPSESHVTSEHLRARREPQATSGQARDVVRAQYRPFPKHLQASYFLRVP